MWKLFAPFVSDNNYSGNRKEIAALAGVGAVSLCYWVVHLAVMLYFIHCRLPILVVSNACGVLICFLSFWNNRKGYAAFSVFLLNIEICIHCVLNVLLLGWQTDTQWFLLAAMIPCQILFPLSRAMRRFYTFLLCGTMLVCYILRDMQAPFYPGFNPDVIVLINILAFIGVSIVVMRFNAYGNRVTEGYYEQRISHLSNDAHIDALTGLWNRRYAMEQMRRLAGEDNARFAIAMLDVDFFKGINDTYGHPFGDVVLRRLSENILHQFRSNDIAVRWGGEEFLIILAGADSALLKPKLEQFREVVQAMVITDGDNSVSITITIGVSEYREGMHISDVIQQSDIALYYGKKHGRNQVVRYDELPVNDARERTGLEEGAGG